MGTTKQMRLPVACALAVMIVARVEAQVQEIVLHNFTQGTGAVRWGVLFSRQTVSTELLGMAAQQIMVWCTNGIPHSTTPCCTTSWTRTVLIPREA